MKAAKAGNAETTAALIAAGCDRNAKDAVSCLINIP